MVCSTPPFSGGVMLFKGDLPTIASLCVTASKVVWPHETRSIIKGGLKVLLPKILKKFTDVGTNVSVVLKAIKCHSVWCFYVCQGGSGQDWS